MDDFKIQALIAQNKVATLSQVDLDNTYLQVGIYQKGNQKRRSGNANTYPPAAMSLSQIVNFSNIGLFAQTSNSIPITNTTDEMSLIDGGVGNLFVSANTFRVGDSFRADMSGHISSKNNQNIRIKVKTGNVILADTSSVTLPGITDKHWDIKLTFTIRAIGSAGVASIASMILFTYTKNANNAIEGKNTSIINNVDFDTTITNTLEITAQWENADPLNSIYTEQFTLFKVY